jgi:hypothetical protein
VLGTAASNIDMSRCHPCLVNMKDAGRSMTS